MLNFRSIRICMILSMVVVLFMISCTPEDESFVYSGLDAGGSTTVYSAGPDAYTFPLANLDASGINQHFIADGLFGQQFVSAPATIYGGLGPLFNQNSCESCHTRNGRGAIPQFDGDPNSGFLLRLSVPGTQPSGMPIPVPNYGFQLQTKGIFGVIKEGKIGKDEIKSIETYLDGSMVTLRKNVYKIEDAYLSLPPDLLISPRVAPGIFGLGLLEAIREEDILASADENDRDGDGISGKPNLVLNAKTNSFMMGRFGWKCEQPTAVLQAADAAHNDMGLTSEYFPTEHCEGQENCSTGLQDGYDLDKNIIESLAFYFQTVAVPAPRNTGNTRFQKGYELFNVLNCQSCHKENYTTGDHAVKQLANQKIYPYTDMLLHDMGEGLADHRPIFKAGGREWRTTPLWGIGLAKTVNPKATFLHDGRASTIEEAILWHGGEAEQSKEKFKKLSEKDRSDLLYFVSSL